MGAIERLAVPSIESAPVDIAGRTEQIRTRPPAEVESNNALRARQQFLRESLGQAKGDATFERVINGNELQPITYLVRGAIAARAVARIELSQFGKLLGYGTGFLIAPQVLITNNHVLPTIASAAAALTQFSFEVNLDDAPTGPLNFRTDTSKLFHTSVELDFSVVAIEPTSDGGPIRLGDFGCLPLLDTVGKAAEGEWLTIIQHPEGGRKQICVRDNRLIKRGDDVLWYSTDTSPGSSGSPVFNNDWYVVALHHKGIPEEKNGVTQTVDGTDFDPATMPDSRVKWIANEGVRASRIVENLKKALPDHPLLLPLYASTPASARISESRKPYNSFPVSPNTPVLPKEATTVTDDRPAAFPLEVKLQVYADGRVTQVSSRPLGSAESMSIGDMEAKKPPKKPSKIDAPFDSDYSKRAGFDTDFLGTGAKSVSFPKLDEALQAVAAPLLKPQGANKNILHYNNYSVVMHAERRLAIYSAANVSFAHRYEMGRPPDVWRRDPRILAKYQIEGWYYLSNQFDRGHLTRREDLEYGPKPVVALQSAADTCHFTNCTPQHARFNQNKEIWQGIERYILEESIYNGHVNANIFTGPVLDEGDPLYKDIQYPEQFWKVVTALDGDGKMFATAYIASQADVIAQYGIEVTAAPFGAYKTYQTKIAEIERLTGLTFWCGAGGKTELRSCDPLETAPVSKKARRRRINATESAEAGGVALPAGYFEISDLDDIHLPE
jgi:endonuclease G